MSRKLLIFLFFVVVTCEDKKNTIRKDSIHGKDHHGNHGHYGHHDYYMAHYGDHYLLKYLVFFAIKLKIFVVIATIFTVVLFSGKLAALIYYLKSKGKEALDCISDSHAEKIIYSAPPHHHHGYKYVEPSPVHHPKYEHHPPHIDYHSDDTHDQDIQITPSHTYEERFGTVPKFITKKHSVSKNTYTPYGLKYSTINPVKLNDQLSYRGGRSTRSLKNYNKTHEKVNSVTNFMTSMGTRNEIRNLMFNILEIKSYVCRKKILCEIYHLARSNKLLHLSTTKLTAHGDNENVESLKDCERKYPNCELGKIS